jgi:CheY-like chemotaxis protein/anti-sigma regulatory factor (Ser/Thr protein kinase)
VLAPSISEFPVDHLLKRIETTCAATAREDGLRMRVVASRAWIRSDFILLERILLNLVSNAVRYTERGGVVIGCRRRNGSLRIDVYDSGIGIPEDQRRNIFGEFYQLDGGEKDRSGGLGLGLAIVDRLCGLLDHPIELASSVGRGSRFSILVPSAPARTLQGRLDSPRPLVDSEHGKLVMVIDDDELVRDGTRGLLQSRGCLVVTAASEEAAMAGLAEHGRWPDLIISDYHLAYGKTGSELIDRLRIASGTQIPGFLISGDASPERLREARASGYYLLQKPVLPITLRSVASQLLKSHPAGIAAPEPTTGREPATQGPAAVASPSPLLQ